MDRNGEAGMSIQETALVSNAMDLFCRMGAYIEAHQEVGRQAALDELNDIIEDRKRMFGAFGMFDMVADEKSHRVLFDMIWPEEKS